MRFSASKNKLGPLYVDVNFRSGEKHSNHGDDAKEAVARLVRLIRSKYDENVPIIINADSGFLADENLTYFENELKVKYIVIGKLYSSICETIKNDGISESAVWDALDISKLWELCNHQLLLC